MTLDPPLEEPDARARPRQRAPVGAPPSVLPVRPVRTFHPVYAFRVLLLPRIPR